MAIRCSLFGHDWGESHVEREREEGDAEVVVTVREVRTCGRCNDRDVLSENVEVTALSDESGAVASTSTEPEGPVIEDAETGEQTIVSGDRSADAQPETDDGAVILDEESTDRASGEWPEQRPGTTEKGTDHRGRDETAKRDGPETAERAESADADLGQAPAGDAEAGPAETNSPATQPPSEPIAEEADEVEIIDEGQGPESPSQSGTHPDTDRQSRRPSETSEHETAVDTPTGESATPGGGSQGKSPGGSVWSDDEAGARSSDSEMGLVVQCPNCGFADEEATPSLRGGDSCPNCREAYLRER